MVQKSRIVGYRGTIFKGESGSVSNDGIMTVRRRYDWPQGTPFLFLDTVCPTHPHLILTRYEWDTAHNGHYHDITYIYEGGEYDESGGGTDPGTGEPRVTYELRVSVSEEPIATHPRFSSFATEANAVWDDNGIFLGFKKGTALEGVQKYLAPGAEWIVTTTSKYGSPNIGSVGRISSPTNGPAAPSGYNWIDMGGTMTKKGTAYVNSHVWKLSGRGGWNSTIYS